MNLHANAAGVVRSTSAGGSLASQVAAGSVFVRNSSPTRTINAGTSSPGMVYRQYSSPVRSMTPPRAESFNPASSSLAQPLPTPFLSQAVAFNGGVTQPTVPTVGKACPAHFDSRSPPTDPDLKFIDDPLPQVPGRSLTGNHTGSLGFIDDPLPQVHMRKRTGSHTGSHGLRSGTSSRNRSNYDSEEDDSPMGNLDARMHLSRIKSFDSDLGISDDEDGPVPQTPVRLRVELSDIKRDEDDF